MTDAESDVSCQAPGPQNNPQPSDSVPQPQPSVEMQNNSRLMQEMIEMLSEALADSQPEVSDGDCIVMWEKHCAPSVPRARSRSPRRQVGERQTSANTPARSPAAGRMYDHLTGNAKTLMTLQSQPQLTN